jgi:hypothetical protein
MKKMICIAALLTAQFVYAQKKSETSNIEILKPEASANLPFGIMPKWVTKK